MTRRSNVTERVRQWTEREVSAQEVRQALERPLDDREREDVLTLVRWFRRRYPTGIERLAYVRRAYSRWTASRPD